MTASEKRLATVVAAVAAVGVAVKLVYPLAVKPLFDVDDEIARLEDELFELEEKRDKVDDALLEYKRFVERSGGTDPVRLRNELQKQLEDMIRRAGLETREGRVTPKKPIPDRKTGVYTVSLSMVAEGRLQPIVEFLEKCYKLPYVSRFRDVKLSPVTSRGKKKRKNDTDRVKLNATLEVLMLPKHPMARGLIDFDSLDQPDEIVKHTGESYAMFWERKPFSEYVKPPKPRPKLARKTPPKVKTPPKPVTTPKARPSAGDRDRRDKYVAGVLRYGTDELLVINKKRKTREYVAKGDKLDGGELLYVHPSGGIVRKSDGDYFYELGKLLSEAKPVQEAMEYPGIQAVGAQLAAALPVRNPVAFGSDNAAGSGDDQAGVENAEPSGDPSESPAAAAENQDADEAQVKTKPDRGSDERVTKPDRGRKKAPRRGRGANRRRGKRPSKRPPPESEVAE